MKIILLTLLVLYALAMLSASLYSRRPDLAWLTGLNVFCALGIIAASLAACLGWLSHGPAFWGLGLALLSLMVCAPLNGYYLFGRIQARHLLIRGGLSLILWLAYWLS
ncbi:hypothetical protein [uncultured Abiotrophia sp.]|mgnify:CR=1 FL=1|uniref:hypothetical protein n=1 Tax=uncultured Abiotrophia sp. TaxID=316094 RepID=UPI0028D77CD3|nr:hypothetical protein [uncultured Abiotrophia sp.]